MLSVGLYLLAVGFELLCGGLIFRPAVRWRTWSSGARF